MGLGLGKLADSRKFRAGIFGAVATGMLALLALLAAGCGGSEAKINANAFATEDTGGRLQIAQTFSDNGNVPVGQWSEHKFELKNTGAGPLNLGKMEIKRLEGC